MRRIDQAIGVLIAVHRIAPAAGFEVLREASQQTNIKLHSVAQTVIGWALGELVLRRFDACEDAGAVRVLGQLRQGCREPIGKAGDGLAGDREVGVPNQVGSHRALCCSRLNESRVRCP
ncbi:ANTAR domain-containing protein [Streptomyces massasporeus]